MPLSTRSARGRGGGPPRPTGPGALALASLLWLAAPALFLVLPPWAGCLWVVAVPAAMAWWYARPGAAPGSLSDLLPLRPIPGPARWVVAACVLGALAAITAATVGERLLPGPSAEGAWFAGREEGAAERLIRVLFTVVTAPVTEEFVFRGWVQHALLRRVGPAGAISGAALLFAAFHAQPLGLPLHFLSGALKGYAVHLSGSIWLGVAMHATQNTAALLGERLLPAGGAAGEALARGPYGVPLGLAVLLATGALLVHALRRCAGRT